MALALVLPVPIVFAVERVGKRARHQTASRAAEESFKQPLPLQSEPEPIACAVDEPLPDELPCEKAARTACKLCRWTPSYHAECERWHHPNVPCEDAHLSATIMHDACINRLPQAACFACPPEEQAA